MNREATQIIKHLEKITATGIWQSDIFDDWLDMTLATLEQMPAHLRSIRETGSFAEDTEETKKIWARLRERYVKSWVFDEFKAAFHVLLDSSWQYWDTIGEVYMEWGIPNKHSGQFFTPYSLSKLCASLTTGMRDVYQRLQEAYEKTPYGIMQRMLYADNDPDGRMRAFVEKMGADLIPLCAQHIRPLTVLDCACGSGSMLLAGAEQFEPWVHQWGLVQFYGQDIDLSCVKMAKVNMMLYGLNGFSIKCALALTGDELAAIPQPYQGAYQEAQQAAQAGDEQRLVEITNEVKSWKQPVLF